MPLLDYKNGLKADTIKSITPVEIVGLGTCSLIHFDHGSQATLIPSWVDEHKPEVGQYFVTDHMKAWCVPADKFDLEPVDG